MQWIYIVSTAIWSAYGLLWGTMMQSVLLFMRWLINCPLLPSASAKKGRHISRPEAGEAPRSRKAGRRSQPGPRPTAQQHRSAQALQKPTCPGHQRAPRRRTAQEEQGTAAQQTDRQREARRPAAANRQPGALEQPQRTRHGTRREKEHETQKTPPKENSRGARVALSKTGSSFLTALSRCQVLPRSRRRRERLTARAGETKKTARAWLSANDRDATGREHKRLGAPPRGGRWAVGAGGRSGLSTRTGKALNSRRNYTKFGFCVGWAQPSILF